MNRVHRLRPLHLLTAVSLLVTLLLVAPPPLAEADTGELTWSAQDASGAAVTGTFEVTGPDGETRTVVDNGDEDADPRVGVVTLTDQPRGEYAIVPQTSEGQDVSPGNADIVLSEVGESSAEVLTFIFEDQDADQSREPQATRHPEAEEATVLEGVDAPAASSSGTSEPSPSGTPTGPLSEPADVQEESQRPSPSAAPSPTAGARAALAVQPLAAPAGYTTLRVRKAGDRATNGAILPVQGATFYAISGERGNRPNNVNPPQGTPSCTTGANGECDLVVPNRTGNTGGRPNGYWVVEDSANFTDSQDDQWQRIDNLGLGNYNAGKTVVPYMFFTGAVSGTTSVHDVPEDSFLYRTTGSNPSATTKIGSHWVNRRANPPARQQCGVDLALVYDFSTSMSNTDIANLKQAATAFVNIGGLGGTPSTVDMYQFGTRASKVNTGNPYNLATDGGRQAAMTTISGLSRGSGIQYTNWDHALRLVATGGTYDLVVMITDGDPTVSGPQATNNDVETNPIVARDLEQAVLSANTVKAGGARVLALGVGMQTNSNLNLQAISGEQGGGDVLGRDYFTFSNFGELQTLLQSLATENCGGSLTLTKKVVDSDGQTVTDPTAVQGWSFTSRTPAGSYLIDGGNRVSQLTKTTNDATGAVNFPLEFINPDNTVATSREVRFSETQQSGYTLDSVVCSTSGGQNLTPDSQGYFAVTVERDAIVSCEVTNKEEPVAATVKVDKQWIIDGETFAHPNQPDIHDATLTLDPQGDTPGGLATWGQTREPFSAGDQIAIGESTVIGGGCSLESAMLTGTGITSPVSVQAGPHTATLTAGDHEYLVTNTVTCQELTLVKKVTNAFGGNAVATDWDGKLHAQQGSNPILDFDSGKTKSIPTGSYVLSEGEVAGYEFDSLTCSPGADFNAETKTVTVDKGESVTCTFTNKDKPGAAAWMKVDNANPENLLPGSEWTITGPTFPAGGALIEDCVASDPTTCAGLDTNPVGGQFEIGDLHWGTYTVTETKAPPGYVLSSPANTFTFTVTARNAGETHVIDEAFVNLRPAGPDLPMTGGLGRDHIFLAGAALLLLALAGYGVNRRRGRGDRTVA